MKSDEFYQPILCPPLLFTILHLMYADDLLIFCPYSAHLHQLLSVCSQYCSDFDIICNEKKSNIMSVRSRRTGHGHILNSLGLVISLNRNSMYRCMCGLSGIILTVTNPTLTPVWFPCSVWNRWLLSLFSI